MGGLRMRAWWQAAISLALLTTATSACGGRNPHSDAGSDAGNCADPDVSYLDASFAARPSPTPIPDEPFARPDGATVIFEHRSPDDHSSGLSYWVRTGETVDIRLRLMLGTTLDPTGTWEIHVFVNGNVIDIPTASGSVRRLDVPVVDGLAEANLAIPAATFPAGMSTLHVYSRVNQGPLMFPRELHDVSHPMAVYRDTMIPLSAITSTGGGHPAVRMNGLATVAFLEPAHTQLFFLQQAPSGGSYPLTLLVQAAPELESCPAATQMVDIHAFLDGNEVPLGSLGASVFANVGAGSEQFDLTMSGMPVDGMHHQLDFVQLSGLGAPTEDVAGNLTASNTPGSVVGQAVWQ